MEKTVNVTKCPCYGCDHRHEACWGTCEDYKAWKEKRDAVNHYRWQETQRTKISETQLKWVVQQMRKKRK